MKNKILWQKQSYFMIFSVVVCFSLIGTFGISRTVYAEDSRSVVKKVSSSLTTIKTTVGAEVTPIVPVITFREGFANLAEALLPTVVNVSTTQKVAAKKMPQMPNFGPNSPFEDMFRDFFEQRENNSENPQREVSALGSGFVIDAKRGYIVTNNHVIEGADDIKVILHDDTSLDAKLIGSDKKTDLALLQVKTDHKLVAAKWGDSNTARVGNWVMAIGNPFGLGGTVTAGIVSARQRDINAGPYDDFIQTDASINRGNSGGPMFNVNGKVIGVNTAIFSPTGGSVGIGFSVPSNLAKNVVKQLIKYGRTRRGWLGVRIQNVTEDIAESLELKKKTGALVSSVTEDGPAAKGRIKPGDIILEFDGKVVEEMRQLPRIVAETDVGKTVGIQLWRKGKKLKAKVKLGELEKAEEDGRIASSDSHKNESTINKATTFKEFGFSVLPLDKELRKKYNIDKSMSGLVVMNIIHESSAQKKDLHAGDIIVEAGQKLVLKVDDLKAVLHAALKAKKTSVLFLVSRDGDLRFIGLRLKKDGK